MSEQAVFYTTGDMGLPTDIEQQLRVIAAEQDQHLTAIAVLGER